MPKRDMVMIAHVLSDLDPYDIADEPAHQTRTDCEIDVRTY